MLTVRPFSVQAFLSPGIHVLMENLTESAVYVHVILFAYISYCIWLPRWPGSEEPACQCWRHKRPGFDLSWEDPLEEGMATHSSFLAWRIPWTEEPGGLLSPGWQRVRRD